MKKSILLLATLFITLSSWAYDFSDGSLYYTITSSTSPYTASVTNDATNYTISGDITIPSSVTYNSISYSVTSIGKNAFLYCSGITSVSIPSSVITIGDYAFMCCTALTSVNIPSSVTSIGSLSFDACSSLTSYTVDSNNSSFSSEDGVLFNKNKTTLIHYPEGKTGAYTIPSTVSTLGGASFIGCTSLTSITIPTSVVCLGDSVFEGCTGLTSITIPNSVTTIGEFAFAYCSKLSSITIPSSVSSIADYAFWSCSGLTSIYISNTTPTNITLGTLVFSDVPTSTCVLHVPVGSAKDYDAAVQWTDFINIVDDISAGVFNAKSSKVKINTANGKAIISGLNQGELVAVYNLQGVAIYNQQAKAATVSVTLPTHGVYIVKTDNESVKVVY